MRLFASLLLVFAPAVWGAHRLGFVEQVAGENTQVAGLARDANGDLIVGGNTIGLALGDGFVAKYSAGGKLLWFTRIGGSSIDTVSAVAVDKAGAIYVAGSTSSADFPFTQGSYRDPASSTGTFLVKIASDGSHVVYAALVASSGNASIAVDSSGAVYMAGSRQLPGLFQFRHFLLRVNPAGDSLAFSRDLESTATIRAIAVDSDDVAWTGGALISRVNADGSLLPISTGLAYGQIRAMAFGQNGRLHFAGTTPYREFATTAGAFQREIPTFAQPVSTGFAGVYNTRTGKMEYATFLSGESSDVASAVAAGPGGTSLVGGETYSRAFPSRDALQGIFAKSSGFVTLLNADGSDLDFSTFVGDTRRFRVTGVAAAHDGSIFFAGYTWELSSAAPMEGFLVRIDPVSAAGAPRLDAVLNAASRAAEPIAPGMLLALSGDEFHEDAKVFFNDVAAPIVWRNWREILVEAPRDLAVEVVTVRVSSGGVLSAPLVMPVASASPGIYTRSGSGWEYALAWNQDGTENTAEHPAALGSDVAIAVNGLREGAAFQVETSFTVASEVGPREVTGVTGARLGDLDAGVTFVRFRLPLFPPENGVLLIDVSSEGETSRVVPIYLAADERR